MENFTVLNYQGSKNNLSSFIKKNIEPYIQDGKAILDIFSGSAAVSNMFRDNYQVYANDAESYASIIADAILNQADIDSATELINSLDIEYTTAIKKHAKPIIDFVKKEQLALDKESYEQLIALYNLYPTVWNNQYSDITKSELTVDSIKQTRDFYLFTYTHNINANGNVKISNNWSLSFNSGYDFQAKEITQTSCTISRDLHCFNLSASLSPFGRWRYYNVTIRANASILQDLKYEQRSQTQSNIQWY